MKERIKIKGETNDNNAEVFYDLFEFDLPANQVSDFDIVVLLPTGDAGRIANRVIVK